MLQIEPAAVAMVYSVLLKQFKSPEEYELGYSKLKGSNLLEN